MMQCEEMERRVFKLLFFLRKVQKRMEQLKFPHDDKLVRDVACACDELMGLRVTLHYLACDRMRKGG